MLHVALPVIFAELGWMGMGIADTLMVGRLSPEAIGAVGIGSSLFMGVVIFAMGLMLGLDTLVSQAYGAGRLEECHRWLLHGIVMGLVISAPTTMLLFGLAGQLPRWGMEPAVLHLTQPYLEVVTWSAVPLLLYASFRRYLQGMGIVRPVMVALFVANLANVLINWMLIFGKLGMPALGVLGAAWATVISRLVMAGYLLVVIVYRERGRRPGLFETPVKISAQWMRRLIGLGFPAAAQITLEVGVFAMATALAGRLPAVALASHQIALNIAACSFMVPLGLSSAGAVRVGHAVGRRDPYGAERAGWTALLFGAVFMLCTAAVFVLAPGALIGAFTADPGVIALGSALLFVAAVFQLFDGIQGVATGVLRGLGDTRTPMVWNLIGHWFAGLPLGYWLCFSAGLGILGLWWGLSTGLIVCGVVLSIVWARRIHALKATARPELYNRPSARPH